MGPQKYRNILRKRYIRVEGKKWLLQLGPEVSHRYSPVTSVVQNLLLERAGLECCHVTHLLDSLWACDGCAITPTSPTRKLRLRD